MLAKILNMVRNKTNPFIALCLKLAYTWQVIMEIELVILYWLAVVVYDFVLAWTFFKYLMILDNFREISDGYDINH